MRGVGYPAQKTANTFQICQVILVDMLAPGSLLEKCLTNRVEQIIGLYDNFIKTVRTKKMEGGEP